MIGRTIPHAHLLESRELYALSTKSDVLQDVSMAEMNGLLRQIAQLGSCAADIFSGILVLTTDMGTRMETASHRINALQTQIPEVESLIRGAASSSVFHANEEGRITHGRPSESLFTTATRDRTLMAKYELCGSMPDFSPLDSLRTAASALQEGQSCSREYSNPDFFMEQWQIAEERRLAIEKAEASEAKARRKEERKKKKKVKKERAAAQPVAALNVKKYNALGAEFADDSPVASATKGAGKANKYAGAVRMEEKAVSDGSERERRGPSVVSDYEDDEPVAAREASPASKAPVTRLDSTAGRTVAAASVVAAPTAAYVPPPPSGGFVPPPPSGGFVPPPPTGGFVPPPPSGGFVPPPPAAGGFVPPPTSGLAPPPAPAALGNSSLLSAIRGVDKTALKKAEIVAPEPKGPSILDGIKGFKKGNLKSVADEPKKKEEPKAAAGAKTGLHGVAAILSRRMAIQGDEDSSGDDDWDDED